MPSDKFLKSKQEISISDLENSFEIKIDPDGSADALVRLLLEGHWVSVIVLKNFGVILSSKTHALLMHKLGILDEDILIPNFSFRLWSGKEKKDIKIDYAWDFGQQKDQNTKEAVKKVINKFLVSKGFVTQNLR